MLAGKAFNFATGLLNTFLLTLYGLVSTEISRLFKQTCSFYLQVCLSVTFYLTPGSKELNTFPNFSTIHVIPLSNRDCLTK